MNEETLQLIRHQIGRVKAANGFYAKKLQGLEAEDIRTQQDFEQLPFSEKKDLRDAYPLGLAAVPEREIVRIHSSSGTTGTPVIIPYTQQDVDDWAEMFRRCYEIAGITDTDRIQITTGYGLWTAGVGFQLGAERLGAMVVPMGPGNTEKQLKFMRDLQSTVLCSTSSYALLLAEEVEKQGCRDQINLKKGVIGSERWGEKMRQRISSILGIRLYDIYGLTEVYGPGIGISCDENNGIHYFDDFLYFEIIDPKTGKVLPVGETGELVITTLKKQGAPLIRYRTHDLTRLLPGSCPCGRSYPRIDMILGRTDDMIKVKGVILFPGQVDRLLKDLDGASSEYQVVIEHTDGRDRITVTAETELTGEDRLDFEARLANRFKSAVGLKVIPHAADIGELPRSEKKSNRIHDLRIR